MLLTFQLYVVVMQFPGKTKNVAARSNFHCNFLTSWKSWVVYSETNTRKNLPAVIMLHGEKLKEVNVINPMATYSTI